ncbi:MAG: inner-membrane translocator [Gammaproteobacteria bacterium]|nr:inner-membrane translocator [Gammaproteobacteria bacterium]
MARKLTGVQANRGHSATDDFITRTHILPLLVDPASRDRLIAEHRDNPIGKPGQAGRRGVQHSDDLARVIDKLRRAPMAGKYVRICVAPHTDYRIGIASGVRGKPVQILEHRYPSEDACEHAIFVRRVRDLLATYGY